MAARPGALECPHRPPCPGCPRLGEPGVAAQARRALDDLARRAGIDPPPLLTGPPTGWRHRVRLAVRGRPASPKVGIFQEGSHRIVDIPRCLVHHPLVNRVAAALKEAMRRTGITPYADTTHRGFVRALQVVVERPSQRVQVVLIANGDDPEPLAPLAAALREALGPSLHSLWWNGNPARTNVILGPHWHRWCGPEAVRETIGGACVCFPPGAFGQANLPLADRLVEQVHAWVPDGVTLTELYAGCGAIGLGLLPRVAAATFNEAAPAGLRGLALGLAAAGPVLSAKAQVVAGPAAGLAGAPCAADVVIADPPRKGLDRPLLDALAAAPPRRLVLVSCNLEAFLREADALCHGGRSRLAALAAVALFPHTAHVETLACFDATR